MPDDDIHWRYLDVGYGPQAASCTAQLMPGYASQHATVFYSFTPRKT